MNDLKSPLFMGDGRHDSKKVDIASIGITLSPPPASLLSQLQREQSKTPSSSAKKRALAVLNINSSTGMAPLRMSIDGQEYCEGATNDKENPSTSNSSTKTSSKTPYKRESGLQQPKVTDKLKMMRLNTPGGKHVLPKDQEVDLMAPSPVAARETSTAEASEGHENKKSWISNTSSFERQLLKTRVSGKSRIPTKRGSPKSKEPQSKAPDDCQSPKVHVDPISYPPLAGGADLDTILRDRNHASPSKTMIEGGKSPRLSLADMLSGSRTPQGTAQELGLSLPPSKKNTPPSWTLQSAMKKKTHESSKKKLRLKIDLQRSPVPTSKDNLSLIIPVNTPGSDAMAISVEQSPRAPTTPRSVMIASATKTIDSVLQLINSSPMRLQFEELEKRATPRSKSKTCVQMLNNSARTSLCSVTSQETVTSATTTNTNETGVMTELSTSPDGFKQPSTALKQSVVTFLASSPNNDYTRDFDAFETEVDTILSNYATQVTTPSPVRNASRAVASDKEIQSEVETLVIQTKKEEDEKEVVSKGPRVSLGIGSLLGCRLSDIPEKGDESTINHSAEISPVAASFVTMAPFVGDEQNQAAVREDIVVVNSSVVMDAPILANAKKLEVKTVSEAVYNRESTACSPKESSRSCDKCNKDAIVSAVRGCTRVKGGESSLPTTNMRSTRSRSSSKPIVLVETPKAVTPVTRYNTQASTSAASETAHIEDIKSDVHSIRMGTNRESPSASFTLSESPIYTAGRKSIRKTHLTSDELQERNRGAAAKEGRLSLGDLLASATPPKPLETVQRVGHRIGKEASVVNESSIGNLVVDCKLILSGSKTRRR